MGTGRVKHGQLEMVFRPTAASALSPGRKPKGKRPGASHAARLEHNPRHPVHVTMRVVGSASGMRRKDPFLALHDATIVTARREDFRIVLYGGAGSERTGSPAAASYARGRALDPPGG